VIRTTTEYVGDKKSQKADARVTTNEIGGLFYKMLKQRAPREEEKKNQWGGGGEGNRIKKKRGAAIKYLSPKKRQNERQHPAPGRIQKKKRGGHAGVR